MKARVFSAILTAIFVLTGSSLLSAQTQFLKAGAEKFKIPVIAPEFELKQLGGEKISSKELKGRVIVLNFFEPG